MAYDSWSLDPLTHKHIGEILPLGSTIVELGSGKGTEELAEHYTVYTYEHDKKWLIYEHHPNITQIYAPVKNGFYDRDILIRTLPVEYDLLIIDGPPGHIGRGKFIDHIDLFNIDVDIIVDDVGRPDELEFLKRLIEYLGRQAVVYSVSQGRRYAHIERNQAGEQDKSSPYH